MSTPDFFRSRLDGMIDLRHPLAVLANRMPSTSIEATLTPIFERRAREGRVSAEVGRIARHARLEIVDPADGRTALPEAHAFDESDESVCERWAQDVYFQFFCGDVLLSGRPNS